MANLTSAVQIFGSDITNVDTTAAHPYGTKALDTAGNEYVYLKGIGSTVAGSWVTYNPSTGVTALLAADAVGPVGIAMAALDANTKFGWYMVRGTYATAASDTVAGAGGLYIDATNGRVDDSGVAGDWVAGAVSTAADSSNKLPVSIMYPFVYNSAYLT